MIRTKKITISYQEFETANELDEDVSQLIVAARNSAVNAYAP
jgi:hypothetical protein